MSGGISPRRLESIDDIDVTFLVEADTVLEAAAASVALSGLNSSPTVLQEQFELEFERLNDMTLQNHFAAQDKSYTMTISEIATATIITQAPTMMPTASPTHSPTSSPTSQPTLAPTLAPTTTPTNVGLLMKLEEEMGLEPLAVVLLVLIILTGCGCSFCIIKWLRKNSKERQEKISADTKAEKRSKVTADELIAPVLAKKMFTNPSADVDDFIQGVEAIEEDDAVESSENVWSSTSIITAPPVSLDDLQRRMELERQQEEQERERREQEQQIEQQAQKRADDEYASEIGALETELRDAQAILGAVARHRRQSQAQLHRGPSALPHALIGTNEPLQPLQQNAERKSPWRAVM